LPESFAPSARTKSLSRVNMLRSFCLRDSWVVAPSALQNL